MAEPEKPAVPGDTRGANPMVQAPPYDSMRRLQIGAGGVAIVLLLVGMAGLVSERVRESAAIVSEAAPEVPSVAGNNNTPLEELGVQAVVKDGAAHGINGNGAKVDAPLSVDMGDTAPRSAVPDLEPDPELDRARNNKK